MSQRKRIGAVMDVRRVWGTIFHFLPALLSFIGVHEDKTNTAGATVALGIAMCCKMYWRVHHIFGLVLVTNNLSVRYVNGKGFVQQILKLRGSNPTELALAMSWLSPF